MQYYEYFDIKLPYAVILLIYVYSIVSNTAYLTF